MQMLVGHNLHHSSASYASACSHGTTACLVFVFAVIRSRVMPKDQSMQTLQQYACLDALGHELKPCPSLTG
jgi:hypothetical protein